MFKQKIMKKISFLVVLTIVFLGGGMINSTEAAPCDCVTYMDENQCTNYNSDNYCKWIENTNTCERSGEGMSLRECDGGSGPIEATCNSLSAKEGSNNINITGTASVDTHITATIRGVAGKSSSADLVGQGILWWSSSMNINGVSAGKYIIDVKAKDVTGGGRISGYGSCYLTVNGLPKIGDIVWYDNNKNGIQDTDEKGVKDVKIDLYANSNCEGENVLQTTKTDENGVYNFITNPGVYCIKFSDLPKNYSISKKDEGVDDKKDSDADIQSMIIEGVDVSDGKNDFTNDLGIYKNNVCIGDKVWEDINRNGIQDDGIDSGIDGDIVKLYKNNVEIAETTTSQGGKYSFCNLDPETEYKLWFGNISGYKKTISDTGDDSVDSDLDEENYINIKTGAANNLTIDAGFYKEEVAKGHSSSKKSKATATKSPYATCKDSRALNFSNVGQHDASLCKFKKDLKKSVFTPKKIIFTAKNKISVKQKTCVRYLSTELANSHDLDEIKKLQEFLNSYESMNLIVDGIYNKETINAVKEYQLRYRSDILKPWNLKTSTEKILDTMVGHINKRFSEETGCLEKTEKTCTNKFTKYLNLGSKGEEVKKVQIFLKDLGFYKGEIDGVYGPKVKESVINFQNENWSEVLKPWGIPCKCGTGYWYQSTMSYANKLIGCGQKKPVLKHGKILPCVLKHFPNFKR